MWEEWDFIADMAQGEKEEPQSMLPFGVGRRAVDPLLRNAVRLRPRANAPAPT